LFSEGNAFKGIYVDAVSDERFYMSLIRAVKEEKPLGNPFIYENRSVGIQHTPFLLERVVGTLWRVLPLQTWQYALGMKFLFPMIIAFLVFLLLYILTREAVLSLIGPVFVLLGNELLRINSWKSALTDLANTLILQGPQDGFITYSRPINPQLSAVLFFGLLCILGYLYATKKDWPWIVGGGLLLGLLPSLYVYYGVFSFVFVACLIALLYLQKKHEIAKQMTKLFFVGLLVVLPYALSLLQIISATSGVSGSLTGNVRYSHLPHPEKILLVPLVLFLAWIWIKKRKNETLPRYCYFIITALVAALICSNQQLITGREIQQHHFHFYLNIPLALLACAIFVHEGYIWLKSRIGAKALFLPILASLFIVWYATAVQVIVYQKNLPTYNSLQSYGKVTEWLSNNSKKDDVVYADESIAQLFTMYTSLYLYSAIPASIYPVPKDRLLHNIFTRLRLNGVTPDTFIGYVADVGNRAYISGFIYDLYWREKCGALECIPDSELAIIGKEYQKFFQKSLAERLRQYKVTYIVWDTRRNPEWRLDSGLMANKVFESGKVGVFAI